MRLDRFLHRHATLEVIADAIDHAGLTVGKLDELIARGPGDDSTQERRVFGVPSIRSDIPAPSLKSVADHQNYGDEAGAEVITLGVLGLGFGFG